MMADSEHEQSRVMFRERTQAMASYARAFFRSLSADEFTRMIEDARSSGQQRLVERLYENKVIDNIVRTILGRIDRGHFVGDQLNDYIHDAVVVLMQIACQGKFDLTKSAGEIAAYVCLWIEQRVKRAARKDQRWRFSLSETDDPEGGACDTGVVDVEEVRLSLDGNMERDLAESGEKSRRSGRRNHIAAYNVRKSERHVLSLFGSSRSEEM